MSLRPVHCCVTGTDTGVGKTIFASLLVNSLRKCGVHAVAVKPVSTGDRSDAAYLSMAQDGELTVDEVNPFHFPSPVAPMVAARIAGKPLHLAEVRQHIRAMESRCQCLIVEGAGGWKTPLGEGFSIADLCGARLGLVVVVAANRLGAIHHALCTLESVRRGVSLRSVVVLSGATQPDASSSTNAAILKEMLGNAFAGEVPHLSRLDPELPRLELVEKQSKKLLRQIRSLLFS